MNIYISKQIESLYFYDNYVIFNFDTPIIKYNVGLSYVMFCLCNGINNVEAIALELVERFGIASELDNIIKTILLYTIEDASIQNAFTLDISEANLMPEKNGLFGKNYPQLLHIELTGTCNFTCSHCYKNAECNGGYVDFELLKERIYEKLRGIVPVVHFTGGEATLHKEFGNIVDLFSNGYILQLTTNGSKITSYPIEIFKKFEAIDVSLYGLSASEYKINTGSSHAFQSVTEGCKALRSANIDFRTTLVVNEDNWRQMEDYVNLAIDVGAESFGFALPVISGKLINTATQKWCLSRETKKEIYRTFRAICDKYNNKIKISDWYRYDYSDMWKSYPVDDSLRCGAGRTNWWMSEQFTFRPCAFLPEEYINLDYDTWYSYVLNQYDLDWKKARDTLELYASSNNLEITDLCTIFRK